MCKSQTRQEFPWDVVVKAALAALVARPFSFLSLAAYLCYSPCSLTTRASTLLLSYFLEPHVRAGSLEPRTAEETSISTRHAVPSPYIWNLVKRHATMPGEAINVCLDVTRHRSCSSTVTTPDCTTRSLEASNTHEEHVRDSSPMTILWPGTMVDPAYSHSHKYQVIGRVSLCCILTPRSCSSLRPLR